ncbi:hypothetical protein BHE74_00054405 [Ensete ventricosum]|nr:hypothetical protein BHE74_00054405 [Ensete ventricosum]
MYIRTIIEIFQIGAGSSFSPKDALTPYSPSTPSLPLSRQRLPLPANNRPCGLATGKHHFAGWPLAAGDSSARRRPSCWRRAHSRPPACGLLPLRVATPCRGLGRSRSCPRVTVAPEGGRPLRAATPAGGHPCSRLPPCRWPSHARLPLLLITFAAKTQEIVYPCILDPDREDEGGQVSSFQAVSTRWISVVKLLQSDLATLAQWKGGE